MSAFQTPAKTVGPALTRSEVSYALAEQDLLDSLVKQTSMIVFLVSGCVKLKDNLLYP